MLEWRRGNREPDSRAEASPGGGICRFLAKGGIHLEGVINRLAVEEIEGVPYDGSQHPMISRLAG